MEERGRELMNEGSYKNRKPRGEGGEVSRKKRSRLSQFREAGLAVNTNVVIGSPDLYVASYNMSLFLA